MSASRGAFRYTPSFGAQWGSSRSDLARSRRASLIEYIMVMAVNAMTTQKNKPFTCVTISPE